MTGRPSQRLIELTDRQAETLQLMARGLGQPAISKVMQISVNAVRSHVRDCLIRLGADNGVHAVALAIGYGLLPADVALTNHARR